MGRLISMGSLCLLLVACGDDGSNPGVDGGGGGDAGGGTDAGRDTDTGTGMDTGTPPPRDGGETTRTIGLDITAANVAPGSENTVCVVKRLAADVDLHALAVHTRINQGSHHMIVYRVNDATERAEPFPCSPFTDLLTGGAPIAMAQQAEASIVYPSGTGLRLREGQMIRLELHYINLTGSAIDITGAVDFDVIDASGGIEEIDFIFSGPLAIGIDARSSGSASKFFQIPGSDINPTNIFTLSTHTHQWGTRATISRASSSGDTGTEMYVSTDWAEPPIDELDPPLVFTGSDGLRVDCEYFNGSDSFVRFGEGFNNEMCFMIAMYYPSRGFILDL